MYVMLDISCTANSAKVTRAHYKKKNRTMKTLLTLLKDQGLSVFIVL